MPGLKAGCKYYSDYLNVNWTCDCACFHSGTLICCRIPRLRHTCQSFLRLKLMSPIPVANLASLDTTFTGKMKKKKKKGGSGLFAYFSTTLASRKLALPESYKTLEAIAVESKIGRNDVLFLSIYRPPPKNQGTKIIHIRKSQGENERHLSMGEFSEASYRNLR